MPGVRVRPFPECAALAAGIAMAAACLLGCGSRGPALELVDEWGAGTLSAPFSLAVTRDGEVLVADTGHGVVRWFDRTGVLARTLGERILTRPLAVAWAPWGQILVADFDADRIFRFGPEGESLGSWGEPGEAPGRLGGPCALVADERFVYVLEFYNHRVQLFDASGASVRTFDGASSPLGRLHYPGGIALEPGGTVLVADTHHYTLRRFTPEGREIASFGRRGEGPGEFHDPMGLAVDAQGRIAVADSANHRIQFLDREGRVLGVYDAGERWQGPVHTPTAVHFAGPGEMLVADSGHDRIERYRVHF